MLLSVILTAHSTSIPHYCSSLQDSSSWILLVSVSWFRDQLSGQKLIGCLFPVFLKASGRKAGSSWKVPSATFLFSTCGFALCTWRQMRHGWPHGPVSSDSQSRSSSASRVCSGHTAGAATTPVRALAFTDPAVWGSPEHTCYPSF